MMQFPRSAIVRCILLHYRCGVIRNSISKHRNAETAMNKNKITLKVAVWEKEMRNGETHRALRKREPAKKCPHSLLKKASSGNTPPGRNMFGSTGRLAVLENHAKVNWQQKFQKHPETLIQVNCLLQPRVVRSLNCFIFFESGGLISELDEMLAKSSRRLWERHSRA